MKRTEGLQRLQDHEIEGALQNVGLGVSIRHANGIPHDALDGQMEGEFHKTGGCSQSTVFTVTVRPAPQKTGQGRRERMFLGRLDVDYAHYDQTTLSRSYRRRRTRPGTVWKCAAAQGNPSLQRQGLVGLEDSGRR